MENFAKRKQLSVTLLVIILAMNLLVTFGLNRYDEGVDRHGEGDRGFVELLSASVWFARSGQSGTYTVGVKAGDWVKYSVKRSGQPTAWFPYADAEWVKVEVQSVSGFNVTVCETVHKTDGSEYNMTVSCDARRLVYLWVIPTNLTAGDQIRVHRLVALNGSDKKYIEAVQINSTIWRSYGGVSREVNLLKFSYVLPYGPYVYDYSEAYCWDKETGFLLEETFQGYALGYGNASLSTRTLEIVDTNLWEMEGTTQPNWSQGLLGLLGAAVVLSAVVVASIVYRKRNRRT